MCFSPPVLLLILLSRLRKEAACDRLQIGEVFEPALVYHIIVPSGSVSGSNIEGDK